MRWAKLSSCSWIRSNHFIERSVSPRRLSSLSRSYVTAQLQLARLTTCLAVGGSGHIQLEILRNESRSSTNQAPVFVFFPPGPTLRHQESVQDDFAIAEQIVEQIPSATFVNVRYRLSTSSPDKHRFPTPIHDVTTAFDYLTSSTSSFNAEQHKPPRICLMGTHIGGALATMLALTEPAKIHALAVTEPIFDWVGLDETLAAARRLQSPRKRSSPGGTFSSADPSSLVSAAQSLINLRARIFPTPSSYFDPFASPMLFLRAPGRDTPLTPTAAILPDEITLANLDLEEGSESPIADTFGPYDDDWSTSPSSSSSSSTSTSTSTSTSSSTSDTTSPKRRKVLRRWPSIPHPESTMLPYTKIFLADPSITSGGPASLLRAQGLEMAELLRRACFFGREKGVAEERVTVEYFGQSDEALRPVGPAEEEIGARLGLLGSTLKATAKVGYDDDHATDADADTDREKDETTRSAGEETGDPAMEKGKGREIDLDRRMADWLLTTLHHE